jgi:hypothetical protein
MRYRLVFITGFGVGFVLGARAGRERYEQLRKLARKAAGAAQAQGMQLAKAATAKLADRAGSARAKVGGALHDRVPGMRARDANGHVGREGPAGFARSPGAPGDPRRG